jgi:hypothetical protein
MQGRKGAGGAKKFLEQTTPFAPSLLGDFALKNRA